MNLKTTSDWKRIADIYDFKGKKVADIGCNDGYFTFEIGKIAKTICGYDKNSIAIGKLKTTIKENVRFEVFDIDIQEIPEEYNIILMLDSLQYFQTPEWAIKKLFSSTKVLILEIWFKQYEPHWKMIDREKLLNIAKKYNHI